MATTSKTTLKAKKPIVSKVVNTKVSDGEQEVVKVVTPANYRGIGTVSFDGKKLTIVADMNPFTSDGELKSGSGKEGDGKSTTLATTGGSMEVPALAGLTMSLNLYVGKGKEDELYDILAAQTREFSVPITGAVVSYFKNKLTIEVDDVTKYHGKTAKNFDRIAATSGWGLKIHDMVTLQFFLYKK